MEPMTPSHTTADDARPGRPGPRRRWLPSTRLFAMGLGFWLAAMLLIILGFFGGNWGSNQVILAIFLICLVVSSIAAAFASFFAVFGFFKYRRRRVLNLLLFVVSVLTNPVLVFMVAAANS